LIPEQEEEPIVPVFVEDEDDIKWDEDGQNILKERSGTGFSALLNHVSPAIASPKLLSRACVTIDTRKPWHPLERQIRSIFPDPEPLLYRLRRQRISTFTAREKKVYVLCRNGAGEREIGCILGLKRERLAKILETIAWKLGVHTAEISRFEPI
jgi:DNA-binding CsgD family transcriptional regulator